MNLFIIISHNTMLSLILILIAFWLPKMSLYTEKANSYECSFDPTSSAHLPFSMKFFLVAITFLLFDLEIALLLPLPWAIQTTKTSTMMVSALILVTILSLGLTYEWTQKGLEWTD